MFNWITITQSKVLSSLSACVYTWQSLESYWTSSLPFKVRVNIVGQSKIGSVMARCRRSGMSVYFLYGYCYDAV